MKRGLRDDFRAAAAEALAQGTDAMKIIESAIIPALEEIGRGFEAGRVFGLDCRTCVGGAVVTQDYADEIGADFYAKDAMRTVRFAESLQ